MTDTHRLRFVLIPAVLMAAVLMAAATVELREVQKVECKR